MEQTAPVSDARRARLALIAAIALAVGASWLFLGGGLQRLLPRDTAPTSTGDEGQPAPSFALESVEGSQVRLEDQRGKVVLVNFWATWCVPCRAEMPEIESAYRSYRDQGFEVLAVNVFESPVEIQPFMSELDLSFPALLDSDGAVSRLYRARGLPSSFLIDRQGVVQYVKVGALTGDALEEQLTKLLK
jgi:peroxiredoxin